MFKILYIYDRKEYILIIKLSKNIWKRIDQNGKIY